MHGLDMRELYATFVSLAKAKRSEAEMRAAGLVQVPRPEKRNGKTVMVNRWVRPEDVAPAATSAGRADQEPEAPTKQPLSRLWYLGADGAMDSALHAAREVALDEALPRLQVGGVIAGPMDRRGDARMVRATAADVAVDRDARDRHLAALRAEANEHRPRHEANLRTAYGHLSEGARAAVPFDTFRSWVEAHRDREVPDAVKRFTWGHGLRGPSAYFGFERAVKLAEKRARTAPDFMAHNPLDMYGQGEHHLRAYLRGLSTKDKRGYLKAYNLAGADDRREADDAQLVEMAVSAARSKYNRMIHGQAPDHPPSPEERAPPPSLHERHAANLSRMEREARDAGHHDHADRLAAVRGALRG